MYKPERGLNRKRILAVDDAVIILRRITNALEEYYEIRAMEDRSDIPVIMLTGVEDKTYVIEGIKLGICDYILKPFSPDDLLERIQRVLDPEEDQ